MRIVLVGAGEVGYSVARSLSEDGHDIVVIENDEERAIQAERELDVIVVRGNGARPSVLKRAGISKDDDKVSLLIACTNKDEVNIMACWIAKKMGVPHVIARAVGLEFTDNDSWAQNLGIDVMVSPERSVSKEIEELLEVRGAMHAIEIAGGKAGIYVFRVDEDAPIVGLQLLELRKRYPALVTLIVCIKRGKESFVPRATELLTAGDICYTMCYRSQVHDIEKIFNPGHIKKLRRVFVVGGGKIGFQTAQRLLTRIHGIDLKLVEEDRAKCERLAEELPKAYVICGDGADSDLLKSEGIEYADGFVATTDHDETNLMLAVLGKSLGASKSIAVVKRPTYVNMTSQIPVDSILDRNQTLAEVIIKSVRYPGSSSVLTVLNEISAEAIELTLSSGTKAAGRTLIDIKMPRGSIIGLLERGGELFIPTGVTRLAPGDKIVLFAAAEIMSQALETLGEQRP